MQHEIKYANAREDGKPVLDDADWTTWSPGAPADGGAYSRQAVGATPVTAVEWRSAQPAKLVFKIRAATSPPDSGAAGDWSEQSAMLLVA